MHEEVAPSAEDAAKLPEGLTKAEIENLKDFLITETIINAEANNIASIPADSDVLKELRQIQIDLTSYRFPEVYSNEQLTEAQQYIIDTVV